VISDMMELAEEQNAPPDIEEQDTSNRISISSEEASSPHFHVPPNNETHNAVPGENDDDGSEREDRLRVKIGGEIDTPAFALLDGVVYIVSQTDAERVRVLREAIGTSRFARTVLILFPSYRMTAMTHKSIQ
jgi:hypothetical protein